MPFDRIVTVDWSGASTPRTGRDSIWICDLDLASGTEKVSNPPTRRTAEQAMVETIQDAHGQAVLLAVDLALAYPAGFADAAALPGDQAPWARVWRFLAATVVDDGRNRSNRFEVAAELNHRVSGGPGPFWGGGPGAEAATLTRRKVFRFPHAGLAEHREAERVMLAAGKRLWSPWQLWGAGSVGSQSLTGIPVLARLRWSSGLDARVRLWPCETGFVPDPAPAGSGVVVVAECWPPMVPFDGSLHPVRDAAQVVALARHLALAQSTGELARWWARSLAPEHRQVARDEEAWILGA